MGDHIECWLLKLDHPSHYIIPSVLLNLILICFTFCCTLNSLEFYILYILKWNPLKLEHMVRARTVLNCTFSTTGSLSCFISYLMLFHLFCLQYIEKLFTLCLLCSALVLIIMQQGLVEWHEGNYTRKW